MQNLRNIVFFSLCPNCMPQKTGTKGKQGHAENHKFYISERT